MLQMPCFKFCWHLKHHPYEQHWKQTSTQPTCLNRCLPTARTLCRSRAQQSNKHDCNLHNTGNGFNRAIQTSASVLSRTVYVDQNLEAEHSRNLTKQIQWNMTTRTTITTQKHQSRGKIPLPKCATFRTRLPPILTFSTRYQTAWNVTKWHACHAKGHDNLLGHIRIGEVLQLPS